jgi:hypothetical protein
MESKKELKMLKYETMIVKLAKMKAGIYLSGGYGSVATEVKMVAMIYGKKESTVSKDMATVYPKIFRKLAGC